MWGFRSVGRLSAARRVEALAVPQDVDVVETPLVPCNKLRAHWVTAADGKLELRWDLEQAPAARTHAA